MSIVKILGVPLALLMAGALLEPSAPQPETRNPRGPNILLIMSDDHAQQAIGAYGSRLVETPNIDRLAREGVRFTQSFVTNSICAPSRAVLLTGKLSHRNGLRDNRDEFDGSQMTFPKLLQQAGYQTAIVGKWHLKSDPTGFDLWRILPGQGDYYNPDFRAQGGRARHAGYVTDLITDFALEFLESRDRERPFLLLYQHKAPHRNWMPALEHLSLYNDRELPLPETFDDDYQGRPAAAAQDMRIADMFLSSDMKLQPGDYPQESGTGGQAGHDAERSWRGAYGRMSETQRAAWDAHYGPINQAFRESPPAGRELVEWKYQRYLKDYLRCVVAIDRNLGRVLEYLDREGLSQDTLVIYTSDQGFYLGEHGWYDKRFMYEESLRTPLIMRHPARIAGGQSSDALVMNLDLAPTLLDIAGVAIPAEMQGRSLVPLTRDATPVWRDAVYYHYYEFPHGWHNVKRHYGVRTQRYKLIHFYHDIDVWELYDLRKDPHELQNLYTNPEYRKVREELHEELRRLRQHYGEPEP